MRCRLAILLLLLPLRAFAGDLQKTIAAIPDFELHEYDSTPRLRRVLIHAVKEHQDVVQAFQRELQLSEAAARPLAEAVALELQVEAGEGNAQDVDALFHETVKHAPKNAAVLAEYIAFMSAQRDLHPDFATSALPYARRLTAGEAAQLADTLYGEDAVIIAADALRSAPHDRRLLEALTGDDAPEIRAAFTDPRWSTDAAMSLIQAYMDLDRPADALAVADQVPAAIAGKRLELALAAAMTGQPKRAEEFLTGAVANRDDANLLSLTRALLRPHDDPFDALADQVRNMMRGGGARADATARLARRGGYDRFADAALARAGWGHSANVDVALQYLPKELADKLRAQMAAPRAAADVATADTKIARLLRAPRLVPFTEHPLRIEPVDCSEVEDLASEIALPLNLAPIRLERHGDEIAGVAVAQTLDPVGEVGRGGYWVVHSRDAGKTWDEPLYTGMRENMPYVVVPASRLPLFDDDALYIEVEVHELDTSFISFPPVALRSKRDARGLYLEIPWSALRRDSDGDGLTDLLEERIATDPYDPDTDGDGIIDSRDGLPQVALTAGGNADSEALAEFLKNASIGGGAIIIGLPSNENERQSCVTRASRIGTPSMFIAGDRARFSSIDINRRVVILSPAELELYDTKFGPSFFGELLYVLVSHDGNKAVIFFDQQWTGAVYELFKGKDGWQVLRGASYIT